MNSADSVTEMLRELTAPRRNNYFYGKRLDVPHFRMEQDYGKHKQWLLNRLSLGKGVLCGLNVFVKDNQLCVSPGVAIDGLGREIIVPLQTCIDPWAPPQVCCSDQPQAPVDRNSLRDITLWLCYRECVADLMPTLVSDCEVRQECAPGTIVETFTLKVSDGLPPELGDPTWCPEMHPSPPSTPPPSPPLSPPGPVPPVRRKSEREILCALLDASCGPPQGDPCVPLAAVRLEGGKITSVEICRYRSRIYSNATLLDLILCLTLRIEECCAQHPGPTPTPMPPPTPSPTPVPTPAPTFRVRSVDILNANGSPLASMSNPQQGLRVSFFSSPQVIRVAFTGTVDINTVTAGDPASIDPVTFSFLVEGSPFRGGVVPGTIESVRDDTIQFRLSGSTPLPAATYRVILFGDPDPAGSRPTIASVTKATLDGDSTTQLPSGDGKPGGNFGFTLTVD
jgi:hypothetical protein